MRCSHILIAHEDATRSQRNVSREEALFLIADIQKKMLFVIKNKRLLKKYGKRARKRVEIKFEENLISEKFLEFIKSKIN